MKYQILVNMFDKKVEGALGQYGSVEYRANVGLGLGAGYLLTTQHPLSKPQIGKISSMPEVDAVHIARLL